MRENNPFRTNSVLGNLPAERQEQIAEFYMGVQKGDRREVTRAWLAEDGITVSRSSVRRWFVGWRLRNHIMGADAYAAEVQSTLKGLNMGLTADQLEEAAQLVFVKKAMEEEDSETFNQMASLRLSKTIAKSKGEIEKKKLEHSHRRITLLEKKAAAYDRAQAALKDAKASKGGVTPETLARIERELNLL